MKPTSSAISLLTLFLGCAPCAPAQDAVPPAASPDPVTLALLPARLQKLDDEIARKLDEVRAVVDSELAAKRLTEPIAQSLRWSLRTTATVGSAVDVRGLVSTMRVPTDNAALTQAVKELETMYSAAQVRRSTLSSEVARDLRRRVFDAIRTATKSADLEPLENELATARAAYRERASLMIDYQTPFMGADQLMEGLRHLLRAEAGGKPVELRNALGGFRNAYSYDNAAGYQAEVQARIDRLVQPVIAAAEKAEDETLTAIIERKPAAEIDAALVRFDEAAERLAPLSVGQLGFDERNMQAVVSSRRRLAQGIATLTDGSDENVQGRLSEVRNETRQLTGKRAAEMQSMLAKLEKELAESAAKMASERGEKLLLRMAAVKQPADLDPIVADVRRWGVSSARAGKSESESWNNLATQLSSLSAAWVTANPALLQQDRVGETTDARFAYASEVAALRRRVEREVLSRALEAPELNTPPLSTKPLDAALDALCDDIAKAGSWRRLYDVLNARGAIQQNGVRRIEDDTLIALRSFFAAQNFELAEQWADAARAYKTVLQSTSVRAPIKPAADRLKALTKQHPEISIQRAPAIRPGAQEQQR